MTAKYILIQSIVRAMSLLEHLAGEGNNKGITAIAAHVGLHKSTCFGLLHTLQELGYVVQDKETGHYNLAIKIFELGQAYLSHLDLRSLARDHLMRISAESQETVHLVIREGVNAVYLDKIEGPHAMTISSQVGQRARMHCAGVGKAILAHLAPEEQETVLNRPLKKCTDNTLVDKAAILAHLAEIRKNGLAIDDEENELGLCCLAAPLFDGTGQVVGAISISGPKTRLTPERTATLSAGLRTATNAISHQLGYQG
jgi:DNA-binding IclR family transcriptional regulator